VREREKTHDLPAELQRLGRALPLITARPDTSSPIGLGFSGGDWGRSDVVFGPLVAPSFSPSGSGRYALESTSNLRQAAAASARAPARPSLLGIAQSGPEPCPDPGTPATAVLQDHRSPRNCIGFDPTPASSRSVRCSDKQDRFDAEAGYDLRSGSAMLAPAAWQSKPARIARTPSPRPCQPSRSGPFSGRLRANGCSGNQAAIPPAPPASNPRSAPDGLILCTPDSRSERMCLCMVWTSPGRGPHRQWQITLDHSRPAWPGYLEPFSNRRGLVGGRAGVPRRPHLRASSLPPKRAALLSFAGLGSPLAPAFKRPWPA